MNLVEKNRRRAVLGVFMTIRSTQLTLHVCPSPAGMAEKAAEIFLERCKQAIAERGMCSICLSGGNTPVPLYRLLSTPAWMDRLPWEKIAFYWVAEHGVPPDSESSIYGVARRELLHLSPSTRFYRIRGELPPEEAARSYEKLLREHFGLNDGEFPVFDLIILGLSPTGHAASLHPGGAALTETKRLVLDEYLPELKEDRISLTLPVFNNARACMFMVSGREKHQTLSKVLNLLAPPTLPAQLVRPHSGELLWVVDEAAAQG